MTRATAATPTHGATEPAGIVRVVKQRHIGRWLSGGAMIVIVALALRSVATNDRFGWPMVVGYLFDPQILDGVYLTLILTFVCMAIGIVLGTVLAVMRLSANPVAQALAFTYIGFFRGTPVLVQLIFWFNFAALYPHITFGIPGLDLDAKCLDQPAPCRRARARAP